MFFSIQIIFQASFFFFLQLLIEKKYTKQFRTVVCDTPMGSLVEGGLNSAPLTHCVFAHFLTLSQGSEVFTMARLAHLHLKEKLQLANRHLSHTGQLALPRKDSYVKFAICGLTSSYGSHYAFIHSLAVVLPGH